MTAHGSPEGVPLDALLAHRDWVRALARRLVLDENDADDVEQETWRMAAERPPRHAQSLRAWLRAVVTNAARAQGRRASRRSRHEAEAVTRREVPSPEDLVAAAEVQTRLARAVLELDEPYRSTVLYRFREGLEASEIAARLGVPVETVRTRLKRAIERLRERMGVELGDDREAWCLLLVGVRESVGTVSDPVSSLSPAGTAATVAGGVAMAIGMKTVAAAAVLVAGAAWWFAPGGDVAAPAGGPRAAEAVAPSPTPRGTAVPTEARARVATPSADAAPETTAAPAPPAGGYTVHGRVLDDDTGAPVANVTVSLVWESARQPGKEPSSVSAADGTFRVEGAVDGCFGDLLLAAEGYAETLRDPPWRDGGASREKGDAGDVRIYHGRRIAGRVLAADGRSGVPGARICLSRHGGSTSNMWFNQAKEMGRSGDDGTFVLERVPPSHLFPYTLFAVGPAGVGWTTLPAVAGKAEAVGIEVTLRPAGAATVTVTDESGVPQANARVFASPRFEPLGPPPDWETGHDVWLPEESAFAAVFGARTDAAGVARFALLPVGDGASSYEFIAHGKGAGQSKRVRVAAGENAAVTIVIETPQRRAVVAGVRVVDPDGRPVEGATLTVVSGPRDAKATTGADGVAVVLRREGEPSREVMGWFDVAKEGFAKQNVGIKLVPDDGTPLATVTLARPAPVDGRIVDQDGKPVAGCYVDLIRDGQCAPSQTTGADGRFSFPDATPGDWTLRHNPPQPFDEWASGDHSSPVRGGDRDLVVVLRRLPVGKARVVATIVDAETGASLSADAAHLMAVVQGDEPIRSADTRTDFGAGTVTFPRVRPGRWRLWVRVPGRGAAVATVDVTAEQTEVGVRVAIGRPAALRGRVELGDTGLARPYMVIATRTEDWCIPQWVKTEADGLIGAARVQPDGTFRFPNVVPGRYRVWMDTIGWLGEGFADVPAGGEGEAVVRFVRGGVVSFRPEAPTGRIRVDVAEGDGPWRGVVSSSGNQGKSAAHDCTLRAGRYRWRATFPADTFESARTAAEPAAGEFTVLAGETVVVDVPVVAK